MAHQPFHGSVPDDRLYCPRYDMWVQMQDNGDVLIGATSFGIFLAGEIIAFTAKPKGAEVALGKGMGTIECRKTVLAVHAPISFTLLEGNEAAEERPALVGKEPAVALPRAATARRGSPVRRSGRSACPRGAFRHSRR